ncbi:hypothetical protein A5707_12395 [Mycobacterium kyorinense]|uniref:Uncharacterized protein n=1 Tax=Mycobacterium kyorinense TaxID=487514 RepID=A0A1A2ZPG5_9MYCO|nr:hypothetical protein [Mycobacterium kyorinense]OBI52200.1 hypothetical protein A5707_12395 [Mycobacterium kyorinense]
MKAKREAPQRSGGDRRRAHDEAGRKVRRRPAETPAGRRTRTRAGRGSAPAREPRGPRSAPQTTPMSRPAERMARPKTASQAKARAKARKAKAPKVVRPPLRDRVLSRLASIDLRPRTLAAKVPFVVLVIGSLGAGLGVTLWLSTDSAERSYQLGAARQTNQLLQQQKEALERDVLEAQAAPALAEEARSLGMIPTKDTAHLIQDQTGAWVVVGTPKPAEGAPPPPLNTKLPDEKPVPPPANAVEVPVPISPGNGGPIGPGTSGPQVLVRDPNGATTLGIQHLPTNAAPPAPGAPVAGPPPGPLPAPAVMPAPPAAVPAPAPAGPAAPPAPGVPPTNGEQFGPLAVTSPGGPR